MSVTKVWAQGRFADNKPFMLQFESRRDVETWVCQQPDGIKLVRVFAIMEHTAPLA